jgi:hypothetical protein
VTDDTFIYNSKKGSVYIEPAIDGLTDNAKHVMKNVEWILNYSNYKKPIYK